MAARITGARSEQTFPSLQTLEHNMKLDTIRTLLAAGLAIALGVVCFLIAPEADHRKVIALCTSAISLALLLIPAIALQYPAAERRMITVRVFLWTCAAVVLVTNILFAVTHFKVLTYVLVVAILVLVACLIVYSLLFPRRK